jgi:hypothetical protein
LQKYQFTIKTNNKIVVENINILSTDQKSAELRLAQMYLRYEILDCQVMESSQKESVSFDKIIDLISQ